MRYQEYRVLTDIHSDTIACVAFSEDGKLLASAGLDGNLCVWSLKTGLLYYQYFTGHAVLSIVWADFERILCGLKDGSIACLVINSETVRSTHLPWISVLRLTKIHTAKPRRHGNMGALVSRGSFSYYEEQACLWGP